MVSCLLNTGANDLHLARVTYHDGFSKTKQPSQTVKPDSNRTIGHYVVGKQTHTTKDTNFKLFR